MIDHDKFLELFGSLKARGPKLIRKEKEANKILISIFVFEGVKEQSLSIITTWAYGETIVDGAQARHVTAHVMA